jgi:hypothetical protein
VRSCCSSCCYSWCLMAVTIVCFDRLVSEKFCALQYIF